MKRLLLAAAVALSSAALAQGGTGGGTAGSSGTSMGTGSSDTTKSTSTTTSKAKKKKAAKGTKAAGTGGAGTEGAAAGSEAGSSATTTTKKSTTTTKKKVAKKKGTETAPAKEPGKGGAGTAGTESLGIVLPPDAPAFLDRVWAGNQREIQLAQTAEQKSQDPKVKDLAQMLVKDHTALGDKVQKLGQQMNHKFAEPKPSDDKERAMMDANKAVVNELNALDGKAFDDAFLATMVQHHDMDIAKFELAITQYKDPQLTSVLKGALPTLTKHRERIYSLLGKEKPRPQARTAPAKR